MQPLGTTGPEIATEDDRATEPPFIEADWQASEAAESEADGPPPRRLRERMMAALIVLVALAWTGAYLFIRWPQMLSAPTNGLWLSWVGEWSLPVLALLILLTLSLRGGRSEQARFADAATMLREQAAQLEDRLAVVNRELSLARDFLAAQTRELESLGRLAAERISGHAEKLQGLVNDNAERIERIGHVGDAAIVNMERLRDQLPVLANSARDMTNQIGNAGVVAQAQLDGLTQGLARLEQFSQAGEDHAGRIAARMVETLEVFDRQAAELGDSAANRFIMLQRQSEEARALLTAQDEEALAAIRNRSADLAAFIEQRNQTLREIEDRATTGMRERVQKMIEDGEGLLAAMVEQRGEVTRAVGESIAQLEQRLTEVVRKVATIDEAAMGNARRRLAALAEDANRIDEAIQRNAQDLAADLARRQEEVRRLEAEALAALEGRLAAIDAIVSAREGEGLARAEALAARSEELSARMAAMAAELAALDEHTLRSGEAAGAAAEQLAERLGHTRALLEDNALAIGRLNDAGTHLVELVRAGAQAAEGPLAGGISQAEARLQTVRQEVQAIGALIGDTESRSAALAGHVELARENGAGTLALIDDLDRRLAEVAEQTRALSQSAQGELRQALDMLTMSSSSVLHNLREGQAEAIQELANDIGERSAGAIAAALRVSTGPAIAEIEAGARRASEAGHETVTSLRDQMATVNELVANLEQRVATAREKAQEQTGDDFARRMALITEALNSSAIDIAKAYDTDVADTQWANYLRGDRGIFTRRAVRLLDKQDARAVLELYEADGDFRETVNRYIHDFEAMLRQILSTRDGNALAVTLLSADVGKLYVCLAQAIERLRD